MSYVLNLLYFKSLIFSKLELLTGWLIHQSHCRKTEFVWTKNKTSASSISVSTLLTCPDRAGQAALQWAAESRQVFQHAAWWRSQDEVRNSYLVFWQFFYQFESQTSLSCPSYSLKVWSNPVLAETIRFGPDPTFKIALFRIRLRPSKIGWFWIWLRPSKIYRLVFHLASEFFVPKIGTLR